MERLPTHRALIMVPGTELRNCDEVGLKLHLIEPISRVQEWGVVT